MADCNSIKLRSLDSQLFKLKWAANNEEKITLRL